MKKNLLGVFAAIVVSVMLMVDVPVNANGPMMQEPMKGQGAAATTMSHAELRNAMRMLWEEHIAYTRNFIISSLAGLEDAGPIAERLLRNQDDIGNAIKPVYGEEAGKKLSALLRDHILIAADIVKAAKAGDNDGVGKGQERWKKNADEIAVFLGGANPNWRCRPSRTCSTSTSSTRQPKWSRGSRRTGQQISRLTTGATPTC